MIPSSTFTYCLGVDVAKDTLAVHLIHRQDPKVTIFERTIGNSPTGCQELLTLLTAREILPATVQVVMEATGVYWEESAWRLHEATCSVAVVNPAQVKYFARTVLRRGKTDAMDARLLAQFGVAIAPRSWAPPDADLRTLRSLMRMREEYVAMRVEESNRLHALKHQHDAPHVVRTIVEQHLRELDEHIRTIETSFKKIVTAHPQYQESMAILQSIPGIGFVTAGVLMTETWNMQHFCDRRQLAAFAGIAPAPNDSGNTQQPAHISKLGNPRIRRAFYMAALSALRSNRFKAFYARLRAKGKPAKVAIIAVAHKLLELAFVLLQKRQMFQPEYASLTTTV